MRKKYIALLLSTVLSLSLLNGCGGTDIRKHSQEFSNEEDAVYGKVSEITEDSVTIKVGTQKKNTQPDKNSSMLELTGEEKEIQIAENTIIKRRTMGGRVGKMSEDKQPPEQPNGEIPSGEIPERSSEKGFPRDNAEEISISDISEGDSVRVVLAEDGSTKEITVISANMNQTEKSSQLI